MLKYKTIIDKLTESQKIRLLTDISCLEKTEYRTLGIPYFKLGYLRDAEKHTYPTCYHLSNTWDIGLVSSVASDIYRNMRNSDITHAVVPSPKIKLNPCRAALSEDHYLASVLSGAYLSAAKKEGISASISEFRISEEEAEWLDSLPNNRIVNEYIVKPYAMAIEKGNCNGVITSLSSCKKGYENVNFELGRQISRHKIGESDTFSLYDRVSSVDTVTAIKENGICIEASEVALIEAHNRYKSLKKSITNGVATVGELEAELDAGTAVSTEMIDEAVDRVIDLAFICQPKDTVIDPSKLNNDELLLLAAQESAVLLKNKDRMLPLAKKKKVAILGGSVSDYISQNETRISSILAVNSCEYIGYEAGYDYTVDRSVGLATQAVALATRADVVVVFLGAGETRETSCAKLGKLTLPANQLELLNLLKQHAKKIIAVVSSNNLVDMSFEAYTAGLVLMPYERKFGMDAFFNILLGVYNPSGKLSSSLYFNTYDGFAKQAYYRTALGSKVGPFIGYRYYDTAGYDVGFPFGHGLSYTKFEYSGIKVEKGKVTFTVKNVGKLSGCEIAQVYIGIKDSALVRPLKELVGFERIELSPHERKQITIPIILPEVYDEAIGNFAVEKGKYTVYVGSSVSDIRLTAGFEAGNAEITEGHENLSDYLQSESNIHTHNYTLEAKYGRMKKNIKNLVVAVAALILAISVKTYAVIAVSDDIFLDILAVILLVGSVVFFGMDIVERKKAHIEERRQIDANNEKHFEDAEIKNEFSAESMFVREFETVNESVAEVKSKEDDFLSAEYLQYVNKNFTFADAAREFELFARERGYNFDPSTVKRIFASMAASRLVIVKDFDEATFTSFMQLICAYFESPVYIDRIDTTYQNEDRMFFATHKDGSFEKTRTLQAIETANETRYNICIAGLSEVDLSVMSNYFAPFVRYVKNPLSLCGIKTFNEKHVEVTYYIPANLWFFVHLKGDQKTDTIPEYIADIATVNDFAFSKCNPQAEYSQYNKFKYYQMDYLSGKASRAHLVDESAWKKIDRFESYVNTYEKYHIGNKIWLGLEKFSSVYLACDGDKNEALDNAMAVKLIPSVMKALNGKLSKEDRGVSETLDSIFGGEVLDECHKMINSVSVNKA